jgi:hypothetical protein
MTVPTLDFSGDTTTLLGFIGLLATFFTLVAVWRYYWLSPYRR